MLTPHLSISLFLGQYMDLEDLELYVPPVEDALTNDIENFPFPTIFDFISEINRPVDPFTMSGDDNTLPVLIISS